MKLFRLQQLSMEYLIFTQNYLQLLDSTLTLQYQNERSMCKELQQSISTVSKQTADLKKELKFKQKCL